MRDIEIETNDVGTPFTELANTLGVKEETVFALEFYCLVRNMIEAALVKHRFNPDVIKDPVLRKAYTEGAAYRIFSELLNGPRLCGYFKELADVQSAKSVGESQARAATNRS
jgi:hypothetical protein